ncbi:hypothetical protein TNCV_783431 [Trichonephila clavipes]|nr:hypothetical protein TNCV_783431 [Trichonephila clavipes]
MVRDVAAQSIIHMCTIRLSWAAIQLGVRSAPSVHRFLPHPAMTDLHHIYLVSSNTVTDFSEGSSEIPGAAVVQWLRYPTMAGMS